MIYRPVDVSWIAERCPEVKEALSHYLKGEITYEDALKLAIESLYKSLISVQLELSEYRECYEYWHGKSEGL